MISLMHNDDNVNAYANRRHLMYDSRVVKFLNGNDDIVHYRS